MNTVLRVILLPVVIVAVVVQLIFRKAGWL